MPTPRDESGDESEHTPRGSERTPRENTRGASSTDRRHSRSPGGTRTLATAVQPAKHRVRHRKQRQGQTIYKGHPSWKMMVNVKLGISITVGKVSSEEPRELRLTDFSTSTRTDFPPEGSPLTPGHSSEHFTFDDHAPLAFRHLREHFGVQADDYLVSICGESSLRELGTPGKSGAVFYLTEDGKFLIKTVSKMESKFLRQILPNYYNYVMRSENTLLPRFFGLIRITTASHRRIRLVIFNNLLPQTFSIHEKYDLKGSTLGRYATKEERDDPNVTLKDLDFDKQLLFSHKSHAMLKGQIESDLAWLRALQIMDYSLLLLLHFPAREKDGDEERTDSIAKSSSSEYQSNYDEQVRLARRPSKDAVEESKAAPGGASAAAGALPQPPPPQPPPPLPVEELPAAPALAGSGSAAEAALGSGDDGDVDDEGGEPEPSEGKARRKHRRAMSGGAAEADVTVSLPKLTDEDFASAFRKARMSSWNVRKDLAIDDGVAASLADGQQVLVFGGLIDILQVYGARKRLEHHYKAFRYRSEKEGISVTDPATYATRMSGFIWTKFSEMPRAGSVAGTDGATLEPHPEETSVDLELESSRSGADWGGAPAGGASGVTSLGSASSAIGMTGVIAHSEQPLIAGQVQKKGTHFPYTWSLRYCAVYASSKTMIYFSSQAEFESGSVVRGKKTLTAVNRSSADEPVLDITLDTGKTMLIRLASITERDRWHAALATVLAPDKPAEADTP